VFYYIVQYIFVVWNELLCHLMLVAVQPPPPSPPRPLLHYTSILWSPTSRAPHYTVWLHVPYKHEELLLVVEVVVEVVVVVLSFILVIFFNWSVIAIFLHGGKKQPVNLYSVVQ